jgi:plastocyanin
MQPQRCVCVPTTTPHAGKVGATVGVQLDDAAGVAAQIHVRTAQVAAVLLAAGAALAPSVAAAVPHAASLRVVLQHNRFSPRKVVVHRGDTVTWLWRDGKTQHNVVSNSFHGLLNPKSSGSFTKRFTRSGSYSYFCTIHAGMTGTIVVH